MPNKLPNNRGVTLVELVIVLVIITVGILPIAAVQMRANRDVMETGFDTEALQIAHQQMERAKNLGFTAAVSDSGAVGTYNWRTLITNQSFGLNAVEVSVTWQEGADTQSLTINNLLSMR